MDTKPYMDSLTNMCLRPLQLKWRPGSTCTQYGVCRNLHDYAVGSKQPHAKGQR